MRGKKRFSRFESLERRQLLAAGIESCVAVEAELVDSALIDETAALPSSIAPPYALHTIVDKDYTIEQLDQGMLLVDQGMLIDPITSLLNAPRYDFLQQNDLLQQHGDRVFAVDQDYYTGGASTLFVFEPGEDGTLGVIAEVPVDFRVDRMIVDGDQVLLLGPAPFRYYMLPAEQIVAPEGPEDRTVAVTVNLGEEVEVIRQGFTDAYENVHYADGRLTFITPKYGDVIIAIYPAPPTPYEATTFEWTTDGLKKTGSVTSPGLERSVVRGNILYGVFNNQRFGEEVPPPDDLASGFKASITRFELTNDGITKSTPLVLGAGYVTDFTVSEDGLTATVVRVETTSSGIFVTTVDLLSLSGDAITVFDSIRLEGVHGQAILADSDYLVLNDYLDSRLVIVEVDHAINVVARDRVRRVELPSPAAGYVNAIRVGNQLVVSLQSFGLPNENPSPLGMLTRPELQASAMLSIDLTTATIVGQTTLDGGNQVSSFFMIDAAEGRFGFEQTNPAAFQTGRLFVFGRLGGDGVFRRAGSFKLSGVETFDVTADRLLVQSSDQLIRRNWNDFEHPIVTPLGEPDPVTTAVDDSYTLATTGEDHLLDVLANDVLIERFGRAQVVELADAPEGTRIVDGRLIRIPARALEGVDALTFRYAVSSGGMLSTATVHIDVLAITQDQIERLVESVVTQAAEDLDVPVDEIQVNVVQPDYTAVPPVVNVTVVTNHQVAEYTVTLDGQVEQVSAAEREILVELGFRTVDADGNPIDEIHEGDDFWLELTAKDMRENGDGVYAAYFDLVVPERHLSLVGGVIFAEDFGSAGPHEITGNRVDELGAISSVVLHPGNALQSLVRIHVQAGAAGTVTLRPDPADDLGHETLLRGVDVETPLSSVRYLPLDLTVLPAQVFDPLDTDADGTISAVDALRVINFLGRFGTTSLDDLRARIVDSGIGEPESGTVLDKTLAAMRRLDANGSGVITALDALVIINRLSRVPSPAETEAPQFLFDDKFKIVAGLEE